MKRELATDSTEAADRVGGGLALLVEPPLRAVHQEPPQHVPGDPLARGLLPPGLCLPVVHNQVAEAQAAGSTKIQHPSIDCAFKSDASVAQRAKGHRDRGIPQSIVRDLVPHQNLDGVGARLGPDLDQNDRLLRLQPLVRSLNARILGVIDGRDAILWRATGKKLAVWHAVLAKVGPELSGGARRRPLVRQQSPGNSRHLGRRRRVGSGRRWR